jgi:hypothetical protein
MKILFLMGAGASYGSRDCFFHDSRKIRKKPPLGEDLYEELCKYFSVIEECAGEFRTIFQERGGFESGIATIHECDKTFLPIVSKAIARYFFSYYPGSGNLYKKLIDLLLYFPHEYTFSTLNYDLLLERSLKERGLPYYYRWKDVEQKESKGYHIIKPHGSCNFLRSSRDSVDVHKNYTPLLLEETMEASAYFCDDDENTLQSISNFNDRVTPVIGFYANGKIVGICREEISVQLHSFHEEMMEADQVIIIGVSVNPDDEHIWKPLSSTPATVIYFSRDTTPFRSWAEKNREDRTRPWRTVEGYFEEALGVLRSKEFDLRGNR